jgi:hypothetical protein
LCLSRHQEKWRKGKPVAEYGALVVMFFAVPTIACLVTCIRDMPDGVAAARTHPHLAAIRVAGPIGRPILRPFRPFLGISVSPIGQDRGQGFGGADGTGKGVDAARIAAPGPRIAAPEAPRHRPRSVPGAGAASPRCRPC